MADRQKRGLWSRELCLKEDLEQKIVILGETEASNLIDVLLRNIHYIFLWYLICQYIVLRLIRDEYAHISLHKKP